MQISHARYIEETNTLIDMVVTDDNGKTYPFTYSPDDPYGLAPQVRKTIEQGGVEIAPFVPKVNDGNQ